MRFRNRIGWLLCLMCASLGAAWVAGSPPTHGSHPQPPKAGVPYEVQIQSERCCFDLSFEKNERYFVVVTSLGNAAQTYPVSLETMAVSQVELQPFREIPPLAPAPSTSKIDRFQEAPVAQPETEMAHAISPASLRETTSPALERRFHLHTGDGSLDDGRQYTLVTAKLIAEGQRVRVFLDNQQRASQLNPGVVMEILRLFDNEIIPATNRLLGRNQDVDGDGKFAVLLSPWLDRLQGGRTSLGGFVRGSDFHPEIESPFSNHCDMMYLNANVRPGPHLKSLLAHEYAHAVSFSERLQQPCGAELADEEDWLNEAIAHCAENMCEAGWSNLDYRISRYLNETSRYPLVVPDYYRAGLWREHGCRGATYLFLRWCVDQYGDSLLRSLIHSSAHGYENLELATGCKFERLYRSWSIATIAPLAESHDPACRNSGTPYRTLDPYGRFGSWGLVGPRTTPCSADSSVSQTISLRGTSTAYIELTAGDFAGTRRISLSAPEGTRLQVSLVSATARGKSLQINADWQHCEGGSSNEARDGNSLLELRLKPHQPGVQVERISCEWNTLEEKLARCFERNELVRESSGFVADFRLPLPNPAGFSCELIVKVLARDENGRRVVGWAAVPPPRSIKPERTAARSTPPR